MANTKVVHKVTPLYALYP